MPMRGGFGYGKAESRRNTKDLSDAVVCSLSLSHKAAINTVAPRFEY